MTLAEFSKRIVAALIWADRTLPVRNKTGDPDLRCQATLFQERIDLSPFAEEMITLAGELQYGVGSINPVYIRQHIVEEDVRRAAAAQRERNWHWTKRSTNQLNQARRFLKDIDSFLADESR